MTTSTERSAIVAPGPHPLRLSDLGIIYFGNDWAAENRTSSHHVAARLSERAPLLYVETPGLRAPKASGRDFRKLFRKLRQSVRRPRRIGPQAWHITMPQIPFRRLPLAGKLNTALGAYLVRRALRFLGFDSTLSWFAVPHPGGLAGRFQEQLIVYYCIDDYAALPDVDAAEVSRMDEDLMRRAGQVFVASALLLESKRKLNGTAVHAPHGVDVALFRKASDPDYPVAEAAMYLQHPVIGFYGLIEAWIDLDLIAFLARSRPDWTFLMIGRLAVDPGPLRSLKNVLFTGPQPYTSLPGWAKAFDVALIPYLPTRQVVNSNPLKLREYLATGKPVVAVSTPEIERFAHCVRIAHGPEHMLRQIEAALQENTPAHRDRRMEAVAAMSWETRIDEVVRVVEEKLRQSAESIGS
jgi:glycosyltransferase involved in cell wall biosynthesis